MNSGIQSVSDMISSIVRSISSKTASQLQKADKNGDGVISREEFKGGDKAFAVLDRNSDGGIDTLDLEEIFGLQGNGTRSPLRSILEETMQRFVEGRDEDSDGLLSYEEFGGSEEDFKRIDKDGDGLLGAEEITNDFIERNPELAVQIERLTAILDSAFGNNEDTSAGNTLRNIAREQFEKFVKERDTDNDGGLSRTEVNLEDEAFQKLDRDGDGLITADELTDSFVDEVKTSGDVLTLDFLEALMQRLNDLAHKPDERIEPFNPFGNNVDVEG